MSQADTIVYDVEKIANYQSDSKFDYLSQIDLPDYTWFDLVAAWFNRLINSIFSGKFGQNVTTPVMIILFVVILLTTLYFLYKKRPELFMRSKKKIPIPYTLEEENIHQINFDKEIDNALQNKDYRLAIRLLYLQTLRFFSDNNLIDWQIHKTPTEYLYEITNNEMKQPFRLLTNHFLHVRYGNYQASYELFETMHDLQSGIRQVKKGGTE
jgi:hypothetical protein